MKKILMTLVAAAMVISASAQCDNDCKGKKDCHRPDPKEMEARHKEMTAKRTQMMVEKYNLSPQQAAQLTALNEKYAPKGRHFGHPAMGQCPQPGTAPQPLKDCKGGMMAPDGPRPDRKAIEAQHKEYDKALKGILTPQQYKAYKADVKAMKKGHKKAMKHHGKGHGWHPDCPDKR